MQPEGNGGSWSNQKFILVLVAILVLGAVVVVSIIRDRIVNYPQWQVTVSGQGKVSYQPDIATVMLGVQIDKAGTAEAALTQLNSRVERVLTAIKDLDVPAEDIQTQGYSVYTQYDFVNEVSTVAGYNANQQLAVKVRNVDEQGDLLTDIVAAATTAGANRVDGILFEVSNLEALKLEARVAAIADAKSKAATLADAAGIKLKRIVGWWDNVIQAPGYSSPYYADGKGGLGGGAGIAGAVPSGAQEIIIDVGVNYLVK